MKANSTETIKAIIDAHPVQLADYRGGREKPFGFFVGQVMKEPPGKALIRNLSITS